MGVDEDPREPEGASVGREENMVVPIVLVKMKDEEEGESVELVGVTVGRVGVGVAGGVMVVESSAEVLELDDVITGIEDGAVVERRLLELRPGMELCQDCLPVVEDLEDVVLVVDDVVLVVDDVVLVVDDVVLVVDDVALDLERLEVLE
jgi:hypothetical protein